MCGCFCLNGSGQVAIAIALTFIGYIFSLASLGDCAFVSIRSTSDDPVLPGFEESRRIGYITFERRDGTCYWYQDGIYPEDQIQAYFEFLGSDWQVGRIFLSAVCSVSWLGFMYTFSLCCTAQVRGIRYFLAFIHSIGLTLFQCLSFLVLGSQFCSDKLCKIDRSAGWSIGAASCYFVAGLCFFCMSDYPGKARLEAMQQNKGDEIDDANAAAVITASKDDNVEIDEEAPVDPEWPDELDVEPAEEVGEEEPAAAAIAAVDEPTDAPVEAEAVIIDENEKDNAAEASSSAEMSAPDEQNPPDEATDKKPPANDEEYEEEIVVEEDVDEEVTEDQKESVGAAPPGDEAPIEEQAAPFDESRHEEEIVESSDIKPAFTAEHEA